MKLCLFHIGERLCAIPAEDVREVLHTPPVTVVPPGTVVRGLTSVRGRIVTVVDRAPDLLTECRGDWLLVLDVPGRDVALLVDTMPTVEDVDAPRGAVPVHVEQRSARLLEGVLLAEVPVHVLRTEALVTA